MARPDGATGMKVCELRDALLDYWVARAEGIDDVVIRGDACLTCWVEVGGLSAGLGYPASTDWGFAGPIIERERIGIEPWDDGRTGAAIWVATTFENRVTSSLLSRRSKSGGTPLIAAMRCYVASKFGEEVPDEVPA
jgi:hypothetical protein